MKLRRQKELKDIWLHYGSITDPVVKAEIKEALVKIGERC